MGNKSFGNSYGKPYNARYQVPLDLRWMEALLKMETLTKIVCQHSILVSARNKTTTCVSLKHTRKH